MASQGKDQNSKFEVSFLLNEYCFHISIKMKNCRLNHCKLGAAIYFGYQPLIKCMICRYFLPFSRCTFLFFFSDFLCCAGAFQFLMQSRVLIFAFVAFSFRVRKIIAKTYVKEFIAYAFFWEFMVSGLSYIQVFYFKLIFCE